MDDIKKMYEEEKQRKLNRNSSKPQSVAISDDPRFIKWVAGKTYRMRLLFTPGPERKDALIHKSTHVYYDADTKDYQWVTCPTSEYLEDFNGFRTCPICIENKELYKNSKTSPSCKEMYDRMKRQFHGFALAFIVSDPVNPANNNTIKIIKYGVGMRKYFNKEIYDYDEDAWKKSDAEKEKEEAANVDKDEIVGFGAFDIVNGFDLIVAVSAKSDEYKEYGCKFSRTASAVPTTPEEIAKSAIDLGFDKEFYTTSSKTDVLKLYNKFMSGSDISEGTNGVDQMDASEPIAAEKKVEQAVKPAVVEQKVVPPPAPAKAANNEMTLSLDDIDGIIAEVNKK